MGLLNIGSDLQATLDSGGITANQTYTFPDNSGTLVTTSGANANVNLGNNSLTAANINITGGGFTGSIGGDLLSSSRNFELPDADGTFALTANKLNVFASTTSAELAGVISDETGSGALVFGTSPTFTTSIVLNGKITTYNSIATAGWGVPAIYGSDRKTGLSAAQALAAVTVGATDGTFIVSANVLVTTATAHNFIVTCSYTDESNTSRTLTLSFSNLVGTFLTLITNTAGTVPYEGVPLHIRAKSGTTITLASANGGGTNFTTVVYNLEGIIQQVA